MNVFKIAYWGGVVLQIAIRAPYTRGWKSGEKTVQRVSGTERVLLGLLTMGNFVFPLIYSATRWLDFANYGLPAWVGWAGVFLLACALLVFWRGHADLKSNWSPSLEIRADHTLMTEGIYGIIRHPMYASQWLWCLAQVLLLQNWLAGPAGLVFFTPFYLLRVRAEEALMLETFGDRYREYMQKTGRLIPKF